MKVRRQSGFTLLELLVVIVIVGVLAAAAVPIYLNYVKDSRRAEGKGGLGAIQTGEQAYFQKFGKYKAAPDLKTLTDTLNVDITDPSVNWTFTVDGVSATGYTAHAVGVTGKQTDGLKVDLVYDKNTGVDVKDIQ